LTIGRISDNHVVVNDPKASSHHAEIRPNGPGFGIIDLGSTNGTFVNNQRIDRNTLCPLANGDRIRIGDTIFNYTATGAPESYNASSGYSEFNPTVAAAPYSEPPAGSSEFTGYGGPGVQQSPYSNFPPPQQPYAQPPQPFSSPQQQYSSPSPSYTPYSPSQAPYPNVDMRSSGSAPYAAPVPPPSFPPPAAPVPAPYLSPSGPKKRGSGSRILLVVLAVIVILGAGGGFLIYHFLTLPKPVINVTSKYHVGTTDVGSTGTTFHVSGQKFSANSAITFLLDGATAPGSTTIQSDANGNINADLPITNAWIVGDHTITAQDASGYKTNAGVPIKIVAQGVANTPGPNGAPADDRKFTINISIQLTDTTTKKSLGSVSQTLIVTGQPDPAGGTVCQARDNGQPQPINGTFTNNGNSYTETLIYSCKGTYKSGKLSYTETVTSDKYALSDKATCTVQTPYTYEQLQGTFSAPTVISGTFSEAGSKADCTDNTTVTSNSLTGTWNGQSS